MLIENLIVNELLSGMCIPYISGITALNRPLTAETSPPLRGEQEMGNRSSWSYIQS